MTLERLGLGLALWAVATVVACLLVRHHFALAPAAGPVVVTCWSDGEVIARAVHDGASQADATLDAALASHPGATRVEERIIGRGPVVRWPDAALAMSVVPGREGLAVTLAGTTVYLTPDELLARQAYDKGITFRGLQLSVGVDVELALALLADRLHVSVVEMLARGDLWRFRVERLQSPRPIVPDAASLTKDLVREAAVAAARHLARGVSPGGRFTYLLDAPTGQTFPGYDWPRHAGAVLFLAQVAGMTGDGELASAARRSAALLRDKMLVRCGPTRCIGDGENVDVGASALGLLAFVELARRGLDDDGSYARLAPDLAAFLRGQQRSDGEFMHLYDRARQQPVDVQYLYYSGEATLALSRTHALLHDPRDLDAATRGLDHLVHDAWNFFGSRYYWGEEHWTCQAMDDLADRAPRSLSGDALDFCLGWSSYGRRLLYGPDDTPFDADGAYGFGPIVTPRLTPAGSRTEAGIATLEAARRAGRSEAELRPLEDQLRRSLAMLLRHQLHPGPAHLFAHPELVDGAMPGSEVDWALRIDYAQHTGCALVRWAELEP